VGELDRIARPFDHLVVGSLVQAHCSFAQHVDRRDDLDRPLKPLLQHDLMLTC
jgi:hypothetical protein